MSLWFDKWFEGEILDENNTLPQPNNMNVSDYWERDHWVEDQLKNLVEENKIDETLRSKIHCKWGLNLYIWKPSMDKMFTTTLAWDITRKKCVLVHWSK